MALRPPRVSSSVEMPSRPLVQDYAGPGYADACRAWAAYAEKVCTGLSPERAARCRAIFHDCSVHELHFWEMSAKPRTDL